jgi:hypothetical protein
LPGARSLYHFIQAMTKLGLPILVLSLPRPGRDLIHAKAIHVPLDTGENGRPFASDYDAGAKANRFRAPEDPQRMTALKIQCDF